MITTSHHTARSLRGFGVEEGRIGVVVPGTDPATRIEGSGGPPVRLLCVAALVPRKGHAFLLESLGGLWDLDWRLVCAGSLTRDAATAAAIRDLAGRIGLAERIEFLGELEAGPLDEQYRSADILALASFLEGYGMVLAEALKRGLPIATTTVGPIPELVPIEASVQAPPGNVQALTKALRRMIADGELRARMAEAAYQAGQRLPSWEHQVAAFADELSRLT